MTSLSRVETSYRWSALIFKPWFPAECAGPFVVVVYLKLDGNMPRKFNLGIPTPPVFATQSCREVVRVFRERNK